MNYFFTFFLQALLPFSLLLGVYHSKQSTVSAKKIIWLSLFGFIAGIVLRLSLPTGQMTNLVLNGVILALLFIFTLCLIFGKSGRSYFKGIPDSIFDAFLANIDDRMRNAVRCVR